MLLNKGALMSGLSDKLSGKAKQAAGKLTDNKKLQAEGKAEEVKGNIKDKLDDASKAVSKNNSQTKK